MPVEKLTYSVDEAAEALGVSEWTVRKAIREGFIPVVPHFGRRVVIPRKALADALEAGDVVISTLYALLRLRNDLNAIAKGRAGRRIGRRLFGKATGRLARRLFG